jgi:hypothetical protein
MRTGRHELGRPEPQQADQQQRQDDLRNRFTGLDVRPGIRNAAYVLAPSQQDLEAIALERRGQALALAGIRLYDQDASRVSIHAWSIAGRCAVVAC